MQKDHLELAVDFIEDLLKEGRREGMRELVSMWISCL